MNNPNHLPKLLIVDDQPTVIEELGEFLESAGYPCIATCSSRQAVEFFRDDEDIGIVLCDLEMPELDGIQLVRELTVIAGKGRAFESVMLTGKADKQDVIHALRAGISDYYQKPVDLDELLVGLQRLEQSLHERQKNYQHLGHLNEKLQLLSESIDGLYQDLGKVRRSSAPSYLGGEANEAAGIPTLFNQLSPRQLDVARLVGKGQTNYQIACDLGITENTVKLYVSQVLRLTHMHNRTQLALALSPGNAPPRSGQRERTTTH